MEENGGFTGRPFSFASCHFYARFVSLFLLSALLVSLFFFFCLLLFGIKNVLCCARFEQPTLHMLRGRGWVKGVTRDLIGGALFCYIFYIHIYICVPDKDVRLVCLRRKA